MFPFGAVDCESCGHRVWFLTVHGERLFFPYSDSRLVGELYRRAIEHQEYDNRLNVDSLDAAELAMDFEDELKRAG